ncbi:flagellar assembly protein FliH [Anoxybacillus flavithermus]|uniref:Flagellar assembly protein FliH n=1 Tax=Anoxybacillus flavithermus TaxID=33934 RepID=A0A2G5RT97_9BACL|nr:MULTISPECIES: flagellar assembly protein FliH [Anoxybacillus]KFZ43342.1 flagellar assembly protein FliH [Anoxybacillus sp. KU2-6(11)]PIC06005.1 flagellar assembly protein FliH [Anoxybacillus flavithermus]
MILLSKIIKAPFARTCTEQRAVIEVKKLMPDMQQEEHEPHDETTIQHVQMIIEQAEQQAAHIRQEADMYYASVQQQIAEEQRQWEEQRSEWINEARQEGYEIGLEQGRQEGFQQYMEAIREAKKIVQSANEQFYHILESADETILLVACKVAERIIGERLDENKEHFLGLVKQVIKEVREHEEVKMYVHPTYYDVVVRQKDELKALFSQDIHLFIYPDETLAETSCIVETPFGRIDASVDTQLEQLKLQLLERIEGASG